MKTIYLKVEVPDGRELIVMTRKGEGYQPITADFTEITLPSEDEIMKKYLFNNEAAEVNAYRREGATWLLNKMKGE